MTDNPSNYTNLRTMPFRPSVVTKRVLLSSLTFTLWVVIVIITFPPGVVFAQTTPSPTESVSVQLTDEEQAWLREHKKITVGGEKEWAPFDFVDASGNYVGISKDYMDLIAEKLDIEMEFVTGPTWGELVEMARQKKIDVLPSLYHTKEREGFLNFTSPYMYITQFIIARDGTKGISSINELSDKTVAVMKGAKMEGVIRSGYSDIKLVSTPSILDALEKVISHETDAFIGVITSSSYLIKKYLVIYFAQPSSIINPYLGIGAEATACCIIRQKRLPTDLLVRRLKRKTYSSR
jgi:ABC-type amino acid transport substrate-binding protein